ncbi:hypothetical protein DY000_02049829 [Brassica cretica]|uniref:Agenet domain-containing protein n=1 Tax=Brassica cretica TaxID=69181 RepID=A0ABQ7F0Q2_BRACR|nr:hypothetical protein DY000_02049829 [Brassica cretica]
MPFCKVEQSYHLNHSGVRELWPGDVWTVWELWSGDSWTVGVWMMGLRAGELTAGGAYTILGISGQGG